ncbi:MAG: hypothetical protein DRP11_01845, partial [Candidatus Aenigmatarchaeota archaeon]
EKAKLLRYGEDILAVMDKDGTLEKLMELNETEIDDEIDDIIGSKTRIGYSLKTMGTFKNQIRVGYNCTVGCDTSTGIENEGAKIKDILGSGYLNGRKIEFFVFPFSYSNFSSYQMDVIFINGEEQLEPAIDNVDLLKTYIKRGYGIVEYVNLTAQNFNSPPKRNFQKEIFGVADTAPNPSGLCGGIRCNLTFSNRIDPTSKNFYIGKIFYGISMDVNTATGNTDWRTGTWKLWWREYGVNISRTGSDFDKVQIDTDRDGLFDDEVKYQEGDTFSLDGFNFRVDKIKEDGYVVWFDPLPEYKIINFAYGDVANFEESSEQVVMNTSLRQTAVILNQSNENYGRAVWVSRGSDDPEDDIRAIVKSAVLWAAGEGWWNLPRSFSEERVNVRYFFSGGQEVYEPYEVILTLWYLY